MGNAGDDVAGPVIAVGGSYPVYIANIRSRVWFSASSFIFYPSVAKGQFSHAAKMVSCCAAGCRVIITIVIALEGGAGKICGLGPRPRRVHIGLGSHILVGRGVCYIGDFIGCRDAAKFNITGNFQFFCRVRRPDAEVAVLQNS